MVAMWNGRWNNCVHNLVAAIKDNASLITVFIVVCFRHLPDSGASGADLAMEAGSLTLAATERSWC